MDAMTEEMIVTHLVTVMKDAAGGEAVETMIADKTGMMVAEEMVS